MLVFCIDDHRSNAFTTVTAFADSQVITLDNANPGLSTGAGGCCTGPYAVVTINRADTTHATVTFDSLTNCGFTYTVTELQFILTAANGNSWSSVADVLTNNALGFEVAYHGFACASSAGNPCTGNTGATTPTVPHLQNSGKPITRQSSGHEIVEPQPADHKGSGQVQRGWFWDRRSPEGMQPSKYNRSLCIN